MSSPLKLRRRPFATLFLAVGTLASTGAPAAATTRTTPAPAHSRVHTPGHAKTHARHGIAPHARSARTTTATKKSRKTAKKTALLERHVPAVKGGLPNVQALGALVLDEGGHELYSRNADRERPIASISKLAATLAVMDRGLELDGLTTITRSDMDVARGGARSRLLEGMTLTNRDLLHAALMGSDNRAIPALGRAVKLSSSQLSVAMTAKARQLGLTKTRFHDPTGLSIENVSTPRETIALLRAVMQNAVLAPITQRVEYDAHPIGKPPIHYVNTYRPAMRNNVQVLGGKTGYNDDARYCLVLAAKIDGRTCYMSFLSNEGKLTRFGDVARVADWVVRRRPKGQTSILAAATAAPAPTMPGPLSAESSARPAPWTPTPIWTPPQAPMPSIPVLGPLSSPVAGLVREGRLSMMGTATQPADATAAGNDMAESSVSADPPAPTATLAP